MLGTLLQPRWLFFFEKWYFDAQSPRGDFALVYLAPLVLGGRRSAELVVCLFPAQGEPLRRCFHLGGTQVQIGEDHRRASFLGGELSLGLQSTRLAFAHEDTEVDLDYQPMDPPWNPFPEDNGAILRHGNRTLRWVVPLPRARLTGRVTIDSTRVSFEGFGYIDFVQTDIAPWRLPLRELLWGRAVDETTLAIWNRAEFGGREEPYVVSRGLVRLEGDPHGRTCKQVTPALQAWTEHPETRGSYPSELGLSFQDDSNNTVQVRLGQTRLLLGEFVADVQAFGSGLERWLYRTVTGNPVEYKLLSRVTERAALASHEWVRWGRR